MYSQHSESSSSGIAARPFDDNRNDASSDEHERLHQPSIDLAPQMIQTNKPLPQQQQQHIQPQAYYIDQQQFANMHHDAVPPPQVIPYQQQPYYANNYNNNSKSSSSGGMNSYQMAVEGVGAPHNRNSSVDYNNTPNAPLSGSSSFNKKREDYYVVDGSDSSTTPLYRGSIDDSVRKRRRTYCGCFSSRKSCCCCFFCTFLLLLVGLGVAIFFIFPRIPDVQVSDPYIQQASDASSLRTSGNPTTASAGSPFTLMFDLAIDVDIDSENYIDWDLDFIKVSGSIVNSDGTVNEQTDGVGQLNNVVVRKFDSTKLVLPITLSYTMDQPAVNLLADPTLNLLLSSCGFFGEGSREEIRLKYTIQVSIGLISWTGYVPSFDGSTSFGCPVSQEDWQKVSTELLGLAI